MADEENALEGGKKKGIGAPIAIGGAVVLAAISGAAAFALAPSAGGEEAPIDGAEHSGENQEKSEKATDKKKKKKKGKQGKKAEESVYVPIEPLVISLGPEARANRLKITLVIEGSKDYEADLISLVPKFRDVLNTYLRAVDARDFESPAAMSRIRAHIARRLKIVAPEDSIDGVLVTDFILD